MAYITRSFVPGNHAETFWRFKEMLKAANWVVLKSSDGSSVFSTLGSEDGLTGFGSGAGGMANSNCWIVLRMPSSLYGYTRQVLIEKKSTSSTSVWRVAYSVAGFDLTTGVTASTAPAANDSRELTTQFSNYGQTYASFSETPFQTGKRILMAADNAAPSGFWAAAVDAVNPTTAGLLGGWMYLDPMASGSYVVPAGNDGSTGDLDPYVLSGSLNNGAGDYTLGFYKQWLTTDGNASCYGWFKYGVAGQRMYPRFRPESLRSLNNYYLVSNPYNGKDMTAPVYWVNDNTGNGIGAGTYSGNSVPTLGTQAMMVKGVSTVLRLPLQARSIGDTLSTGSNTRDRIIIRDYALPWDGSVPTI